MESASLILVLVGYIQIQIYLKISNVVSILPAICEHMLSVISVQNVIVKYAMVTIGFICTDVPMMHICNTVRRYMECD